MVRDEPLIICGGGPRAKEGKIIFTALPAEKKKSIATCVGKRKLKSTTWRNENLNSIIDLRGPFLLIPLFLVYQIINED